mgnify:FL=1
MVPAGLRRAQYKDIRLAISAYNAIVANWGGNLRNNGQDRVFATQRGKAVRMELEEDQQGLIIMGDRLR